MSIATELNRIITGKENIKTSVYNKGVEIPDNALINLYSQYIDVIEFEDFDLQREQKLYELYSLTHFYLAPLYLAKHLNFTKFVEFCQHYSLGNQSYQLPFHSLRLTSPNLLQYLRVKHSRPKHRNFFLVRCQGTVLLPRCFRHIRRF